MRPVGARGLGTRAVLAAIAAYRRFVSPYTPPTCRFYPSCSEYGMIAVERYGAARGLWLLARRIARCHPWNPGGFDPVP